MKSSEPVSVKNLRSVDSRALLFGAVFLGILAVPLAGGAQTLPGLGAKMDMDSFLAEDSDTPDPFSRLRQASPEALTPPPPPESEVPLDPLAGGFNEPTPEMLDQVKEETRRQAFDAAMEGLLPLRPEEIRTLLERFDRTQESVELPVYPAPKPEIAVETLSLDPGTKPKTISVSHGYVTTFTVVDSSGAPWPIEDITWAGDFEIIQSGGESSNFIRITPRSEFAYGNMSMRLIGLQTPIILSMETARDIVHYRFDAIVPQLGPFAAAPLIQTGVTIAAGDQAMVRILEGTAPSEAVKLSVSGADARTSAFNYKGMTYLRTPLTLLSPAWTQSTSSSDGMKVYALSQTPVLLLSENGKMVRVRLSERGELTDE